MRIITTTCDVCEQPAERYPSFFELEAITRNASDRGCLRYDLVMDLCSEHRNQIVAAVQLVVNAYDISAKEKAQEASE